VSEPKHPCQRNKLQSPAHLFFLDLWPIVISSWEIPQELPTHMVLLLVLTPENCLTLPIAPAHWPLKSNEDPFFGVMPQSPFFSMTLTNVKLYLENKMEPLWCYGKKLLQVWYHGHGLVKVSWALTNVLLIAFAHVKIGIPSQRQRLHFQSLQIIILIIDAFEIIYKARIYQLSSCKASKVPKNLRSLVTTWRWFFTLRTNFHSMGPFFRG